MKKSNFNANTSIYEIALAAKLGGSFVSRDNEQFSQMKYDVATRLPWLEQKVAEALEMKTDEVFVHRISEKVKDIKALQSELIEIMRVFKAQIRYVDPKLSKEVAQFKIRVKIREDLEMFLGKINGSINLLDEKQSVLQGVISADDIMELRVKWLELCSLVKELGELKSERREQTKKRNKLSNEIYSELQVITGLGKAVWYGRDTVKYENYLLSNYFKKRRTSDPPDENELETLSHETEGNDTNWSPSFTGMR